MWTTKPKYHIHSSGHQKLQNLWLKCNKTLKKQFAQLFCETSNNSSENIWFFNAPHRAIYDLAWPAKLLFFCWLICYSMWFHIWGTNPPENMSMVILNTLESQRKRWVNLWLKRPESSPEPLWTFRRHGTWTQNGHPKWQKWQGFISILPSLVGLIVFGCFSPPVRWGLLDFMWALLLLLLFRLLLPPLRRHLHRHLRHHFRQTSTGGSRSCVQHRTSPGNSRSQCAAPDLTPERSVQRRTSPGELPSGVCSAGPHPRSSRAECAALDLTRQKMCQEICQKGLSEICQTWMSEYMSEEMSEDMSKDMSEDMSKDMSEKNVRKNVTRYVRKECQKEFQ